jgi:hypothetical protein
MRVVTGTRAADDAFIVVLLPLESIMFLRTAHRVLSISLAAVLTLGMLGVVDGLSQPDTATAHWAQQDKAVRA